MVGDTEKSKVEGRWTIIIRDAKTEKEIQRIEKKNIITNGGKAFFARMLASPCVRFDTGGNYAGRCHAALVMGTGTTTPTESDTGLSQPVDATAKLCSISHDNNETTYYVRYMPEDANGYTYTELGIYDGLQGGADKYSSGVLINHLQISPAIEKTNDILVDIYVTIKFL
ncbi:MAG: hypothetical protein GXO43_02165 [Crenarchaeota archaeon]|nr:hypothetical protein [Thermoproteota archaeon]